MRFKLDNAIEHEIYNVAEAIKPEMLAQFI